MKTKTAIWIIVILAVIVGLIIWGTHASKSITPAATVGDTSSLPGMQAGTAPWIAETANLAARLKAIGLPALKEEGTVLHTHQHLDIYIDGKPVAVPPGIGINEAAQFISPIHVHDSTSVIHVESPTVQTFTLGQFFDVWGVKFTADCIGGYCAAGDKTLTVYINGQTHLGNPREIELTPHEEIAVVYGTPAELPSPMPSSFTFPDGE